MKLRALAIWIAGLAAILSLASVTAATPVAGSQTLTVQVGGGQGTVAANDFFPDNITIHAGDTIHFTNPYPEIHTVSFLPAGMAFPDLVVPGPNGPPQFGINPVVSTPTSTTTTVVFDPTKYLNSGIMNKGDSLDVTFNQTGTYRLVCLVHGVTMSIDVTVVAPGSQADTQALVDTRAANQLQLLMVQAGPTAATTHPSPATTTLPDGSTNWKVVVGATVAEDAIDQFFPADLQIKVGDTVTWTNPTAVPHTVTFLSGGTLPSLITPLANSSGGAPFLEFTPQLFLPSGGPTYDGTGYVNSGFIQQGTPSSTFSLTFTKPGTYTYVCGIHDDQGMMGTITVVGAAPAASPTAPTGVVAPNTGTGPQQQHDAWVPWLLISAMLGLACATIGFRLRPRRG